LKTFVAVISVEPGTRELAKTVKRWIAELQQRKGAQVHSLPCLPVITAAASQNT